MIVLGSYIATAPTSRWYIRLTSGGLDCEYQLGFVPSIA
jgi:hypothetical protein